MKRTYQLDEDDIKEIVASYFNVPISDVNLTYNIKTEDYGMAEHDMPVIHVEVLQDNRSREDLARQRIREDFEESISNGWVYG